MQYNGGKTRIAKHIAPIVRASLRGRPCWEPFCGGLGMTEHLRPALASDIHPGLIALYQGGLPWVEANLADFECSEYDYAAAKLLPDSDPLKAFIGFGCSFGGKWFGGFGRTTIDAKHPNTVCTSSRKVLARKLAACAHVKFQCLSFFDVVPEDGMVLYLDPPYRGTTLAGADRNFSSDAFMGRCEKWASAGSVVFLSEYDSQIGALVWEGARPNSSLDSALRGTSGKAPRPERLYRLG